MLCSFCALFFLFRIRTHISWILCPDQATKSLYTFSRCVECCSEALCAFASRITSNHLSYLEFAIRYFNDSKYFSFLPSSVECKYFWKSKRKAKKKKYHKNRCQLSSVVHTKHKQHFNFTKYFSAKVKHCII